MKIILLLIPVIYFMGCKDTGTKEDIKDEIMQTEKAFERMTSEKGPAEAFFYRCLPHGLEAAER